MGIFKRIFELKGGSLVDLGDEARRKGRNGEAIEYYDRAIKNGDSDLNRAWIHRGNALQDLGQYDEAIKSYDKALEIQPDFAITWLNRGIALLNLNRYDEAEKTFIKAIELGNKAYVKDSSRGPDLIKAHKGLIYIYLNVPPVSEINNNKPFYHYLEIIKLDPNDQEANSWLKKNSTFNPIQKSYGWSENVRKQLNLARKGDRDAFSQLIDLIYENPLPLNMPMMNYNEVTKLLKYSKKYTPIHEIAAVQTAGEYQEWHEKVYSLVSEIKEVLIGFPSSGISNNNIDAIVNAAGYELKIYNSHSLHSHTGGVVHHLDVYVNQTVEDKPVETINESAIKQLCKEKTPLTSNILHKIQNKQDFCIKTGNCTSYSEKTISFSAEREMARKELEQRGNPPFNQNNYFI
jgi:tetratricopeptide (TPR) repeat protein